MPLVRVGDSLENSDATFVQREAELKQQAFKEIEKRKAAEKSAFSRFAQQNIEKTEVLMRIAESPLATKIYLLIVKKMDGKNALAASYQFFMDYFGTSKSSVRRAMHLLQMENVLQIKRRNGITIYLLNPDIVWKDKGNKVKYCEFEGKIILTEAEWSDEGE